MPLTSPAAADLSEHDWTLSVGPWDFGLEQYLVSTGGYIPGVGPGLVEHPRTTIYVGPVQFDTSLSAYGVASLAIGSALLGVVLVATWLVLTMRTRQRTT